jgi:hypothetical protein
MVTDRTSSEAVGTPCMLRRDFRIPAAIRTVVEAPRRDATAMPGRLPVVVIVTSLLGRVDELPRSRLSFLR